METFMREALRPWLRGARMPEVIEVLELPKAWRELNLSVMSMN